MPTFSLNHLLEKISLIRVFVAWLTLLALLTLFAGCETKQPPQRLAVDDRPEVQSNSRSFPCNILLVGNDTLEEPLQRQWSARHDSDFQVMTISQQAFAEADFKIEPNVDVVIYPSHLMLELIHRQRIVKLAPSTYRSEAFNKNDVLPHFRKSGIRYDSETWAVPCGGPLFAMLYHSDALTATEMPPETWSQLIRWGERLAAVENNKLPSKLGLPLAEGWAAKTFLTIAAPYSRHTGSLSVLFERRSMKPLIESEAFIKALDQLKLLAKQNSNCLNQTPADVLQELLDGKIAVGITWPAAAITPTDAEAATDLMIGPMPGSKTYFDDSTGGWGTRQSDESNTVNLHGMSDLLASHTKACRRPQSAAAFLKWLPATTISKILFANDPTSGPFRTTHLGELKPWLGDHYSLEFEKSFSNHLKDAHQKALILKIPDILRQSDYLAVLDREIRQCLGSDLPSAECLKNVAQQWEELTETIGRKTQSNILRRNSNF